MAAPRPVAARLDGRRTLLIDWADGTTRCYPMDFLRAHCPCAVCVDELTGEIRVRREMFPETELAALAEVGRYAFRVTFSDGHDTGLFTYKLLHEIGQLVQRDG
jgi:DUF971 family protein